MLQLDSRWLRKEEPEHKKKFEQALLNDTLVLGRLYEILEDMQNEVERQGYTEKDFDNPNWAHKVAFRNGQTSAITKVLALLSFIKD